MAKQRKRRQKKKQNVFQNIQLIIKALQVFLSNMRVKKPKKEKILPWKAMGHLFLFSFVFIYDEILLRVFNGKGIFSHLIYPVIFGIAAGVFVNVFTTIFNKKINRIISTVIMSAAAILFITETLVKRTFQVYMTIPALLSGAGGVAGNYTGEMVGTIFGGIPVIFLFLLPVVLYWFLGRRFIPACQYKWPVAILNIVLSLAIFIVGVLFASIGPSRQAYGKQYEFNNATEVFGLLTSLRLSKNQKTATLKEVVEIEEEEKRNEWEGEDYSQYGKNVMDIDLASLASEGGIYGEVDTFISNSIPSSQNKFTGIFKGKNLLLICAEAFSGAVVSEELTPTLYRMIHNGFYFSDFYQPTWGGSTSSGEYSFLMGLVPMYEVESVFKVKDNNNYFTMGNQMQRLGYFTGAYHDGDFDYYDRDQTHMNFGYNYWKAWGNGLEEICDDFRDFQLFDRTLPEYQNNEPFSMYFMSMDGHSAYVPEHEFCAEHWDHVTSIIGTGYSATTTAYYCYQYSFELALQNLVQKLEDAGIMDDTVICICPDHYPYGLSVGAYNNDVDYFSELIGQENVSKLTQDKNSMVIWSSCLEEGKELAEYQCEISSPTYSLDILPTLSNLFGLNFDSRMLVGRDVFSDASPLVLWPDYSWLTRKGFYDAETEQFYPNEGESADQAYIDNVSVVVENKLNLSLQISDIDYYSHVFGADDVIDSTQIALDPEISNIIQARKNKKNTEE